MISLSLSNLIKNFLNIQDDNVSFPEEEYCQVIQKGDYRIKVFKRLWECELFSVNSILLWLELFNLIFNNINIIFLICQDEGIQKWVPSSF